MVLVLFYYVLFVTAAILFFLIIFKFLSVFMSWIGNFISLIK